MIVPGVSGTVGTGSTTVTPGAPAGMFTGQRIFEVAVVKPDTVTAPTIANWTLEADFGGGGGTQGPDAGPSKVLVYSRVKDTGWSTMSAIATLTGADSSAAVAFGQLPGGGSSISTAVATGVYDPGGSGGTAWSATMSTDPGIQENDRLIVICGNQSDGPTWSNQALTVPGCTLTAVWERTEALEGITSQDVGGMICEFMVKSGTSTGVATFTATATAASRGPTVLLRLREVGVPSGLIHGIEPEAANGFVGPIVDSNGNLYRVTEEYLAPGSATPEFGNHPMMMKSSDGGLTWKRMDSANGPGYALAGSFNDMESASMVLRPGRQEIELCYMKGESRWWGVTYRTSDHPTAPDTWLTSSIGTSAGVETFPATVASESAIACCALSDGTVRAFVRGQVQGGFQSFSHRVKATTTWSAGTYITDGRNIVRPQCVVNFNNDDTYLFYRDDTNGQVRYRIIDAAGTVGASARVDSGGAGASGAANYQNNVVPPVLYMDGATPVAVVAFVNASNLLRTVEVRGGVVQAEEQVSTNTVTVNPLDLGGSSTDNMGPSAALAVIGTTLYAFWGDVTTGDVYYASRPNGGSWSARTLFKDTGTGQEAQWLYAAPVSATKIGVTTDIGRHFDDDSTVIYNELETQTTTPVVGSESTAITATETASIANTLTTSDTASLAVSDASQTLVTVAATDTAAISVAETRTQAATLSSTDSGAISITETRTQASTLSGTDTAAISVAETVTQAVSLSRTDTAAITATDTVASLTGQSNDPAGSETTAIAVSETTTIFVTVGGGAVEDFAAGASTPGLIMAGANTVINNSIGSPAAPSIQSSGGTGDYWYLTDPKMTHSGDFTLSYDIFLNSGSREISNFMFFVTNPGATPTGYAFRIQTSANDGGFNYVINGAQTGITPTTAAVSASTWYRATLTVTGDSATMVIQNRDTQALHSTTTRTLPAGNRSGIVGKRQDGLAGPGHEIDNIVINGGFGADSAALTVTDVGSVGGAVTPVSASDSAAISVTETSAVFKTMVATDQAAISVAETTQLVGAITPIGASDTAALAVTDTATVPAIINSITATDGSAISVVESNTRFVTKTATDQAALTVTETTASFRTVATTDTVAITVADAGARTSAFPGTDTAAISVTESSSVLNTTPPVNEVEIDVINAASPQISVTQTTVAVVVTQAPSDTISVTEVYA